MGEDIQQVGNTRVVVDVDMDMVGTGMMRVVVGVVAAGGSSLEDDMQVVVVVVGLAGIVGLDIEIVVYEALWDIVAVGVVDDDTVSLNTCLQQHHHHQHRHHHHSRYNYYCYYCYYYYSLLRL